MTAVEIPIPPTPGPFVNTPLLPLGDGAFWISTYNPVHGAIGVLVDRGGHREFPLGPDCPGAYSAVPDGAGGLWLCGDVAAVRRLDLATGDVVVHATGHTPALMFQGMHLDERSGRLLLVAFDGLRTDCVVFDTGQGRTVATLALPGPWRYLRASLRVDGVPHLVVETPGIGVVRVRTPDSAPTLEPVDVTPPLAAAVLAFADTPVAPALLRGELPADHAWVRAAHTTDGLRCLAVRDGVAVCASSTVDGAVVTTIDQQGHVEVIAEVPDAMPFNIAIDEDEVVAVDTFGILSRWSLPRRTRIGRRDLDVRSIGAVDVVVPIDEHTLLGSTFIAQRFWTVDLRTGAGLDRGRAAPGFGEVLHAVPHDGRVLMAAYSGGELMSWAPGGQGSYPQNPRVLLADRESMRPVALLSCGATVLFAASQYYGTLGSRVIEVDPATGDSTSLTIDDLRITGAVRTPDAVVAATTVHADARSAAPTADRCAIIAYGLSPLREIARIVLDPRWDHVFVHGPLSATRVLCSGWDPVAGAEDWFSVDTSSWLVSATSPVRLVGVGDDRVFPGRPDLLAGPSRIRPTGVEGRFVVHVDDRFELWDMSAGRRIGVVAVSADAYAFEVDDDTLTIVEPSRLRRVALAGGAG